MSVSLPRSAAADAAVRRVMNQVIAEVLVLLGLLVEPFGDGTGQVVRRAAR